MNCRPAAQRRRLKRFQKIEQHGRDAVCVQGEDQQKMLGIFQPRKSFRMTVLRNIVFIRFSAPKAAEQRRDPLKMAGAARLLRGRQTLCNRKGGAAHAHPKDPRRA